MKTLIYLILFLSGPLVSADVPTLVNGLVQLRSELETLNRDVESRQKELQAEHDLWVQKKLELQAALQRETLRDLQLSEKIGRLARRVKHEGKSDPQAKQEFSQWLNSARAWIQSSLPFRSEQRLQTVDNLEQRAQRGMESLESLTAELWMFYENELKMAGANEFRLDKVEVVRLGLFTMYTRDTKGMLNQTVFKNGQWTAQPVAKDAHADVTRLFVNMKAKKETGLYNLGLLREVL